MRVNIYSIRYTWHIFRGIILIVIVSLLITVIIISLAIVTILIFVLKVFRIMYYCFICFWVVFFPNCLTNWLTNKYILCFDWFTKYVFTIHFDYCFLRIIIVIKLHKAISFTNFCYRVNDKLH